MSRAGALCLVVLVACGSGGSGAAARAPAPPELPPAEPAVPLASDPLERPAPARRGVPHYGAIVSTAVSHDGAVVLSRDTHGDLRLWATRDGTTAPQDVPVERVTTMRVQAGAAGALVGLVDESGTGHLLRYARDGALGGTATFPAADVALTAVVPLGDATAALLVRADWSLELASADGGARGGLAMRGTRVLAIEAVGADQLVALVRSVARDVVGYRLVHLRAKDGTLARGADVTLPRVPLERLAVLAVSPDGAHAAYFWDPSGRAEPPPAAGLPGPRGVPRRPPPPRGMAIGARVVVIETATGKDVTPAELAALDLTDPQQLGFTAPGRLLVFTAGGDWTVGVLDGTVLAGNVGRSTAPSTGAGVVVTGFDRFVTTMTTAGEVRYLGYAASYPMAAGLSDDGRRVAWATRDGAVVIEEVGGAPGEIDGPVFEGGAGLVRFVGDDHVLVVAHRGVAHLLDARTGAEIAAVPVTGSAVQMAFHAGRRWLAGPHDGGGAWVIAIDPAATPPFRRVAVVPDGAVQVALLDAAAGDAPALLTVDRSQQVRIYTANELSAGLSPSAIRGRWVTKSLRPVNAVDGASRMYGIEGRRITVREPLDPSRPPAPDAILTTSSLGFDALAVAPAPDGSFAIVLDHARTLEAIGLDGRSRWTASATAFAPIGWSFSADGRRFVIVSQDGGTIFDTATGEPVATGCAWRFGAWANPPGGFSLGVPPLCR